MTVGGELRDWVPIQGADFQGNVIRYGVGLSYRVDDTDTFAIVPVIEVVGWTVLNGMETASNGFNVFEVHVAGGDSIANIKARLRAGLGENNSLYVGYGHALTGDTWYRDIIRAEYRLAF